MGNRNRISDVGVQGSTTVVVVFWKGRYCLCSRNIHKKSKSERGEKGKIYIPSPVWKES